MICILPTIANSPFWISRRLRSLGGKLQPLSASDRKLRERIREARSYGYVIANKGRGYFLAADEEDMAAFYRVEHARAMSILQGLSPLRKHLKDMGVAV